MRINSIWLHVLASLKTDKPICKTCRDTRKVRKLWKRNSTAVFIDADCPDCTRKEGA